VNHAEVQHKSDTLVAVDQEVKQAKQSSVQQLEE
jgi:hypothetical protein